MLKLLEKRVSASVWVRSAQSSTIRSSLINCSLFLDGALEASEGIQASSGPYDDIHVDASVQLSISKHYAEEDEEEAAR